MLLALGSVIIIVVDGHVSMPPEEQMLLQIADNVIWGIFIADYFIGLFLSANKSSYIKTHVLELIAILPFNAILKGLRVLRIFRVMQFARVLRIARMARIIAYFGRALGATNRFMTRHSFQYVLIITCGIVLLGSAMIIYFEKMDVEDALWWSFVTATTVGYGDISPRTVGGRIVASVLMLAGIGFIGVLTGNIASFFIAEDSTKSVKEEMVNVAIKKLEDFDSLTEEELTEVFNALVAIKKAH